MRYRLLEAAWLALGLVCAPRVGLAEDARPDGAAESASREILFVLGAGDEDVADSEALSAAVQAQLAGTQTRVTFVRFDAKHSTLREQVSAARELAASAGAMGIFWLETAADGDWLLYLAEPDAERILVRRLEVTSVSAGTEVVGVITGHSAEALASGQTIGMQPVDLKDTSSLDVGREVSPFEPPPAPAQKPKKPASIPRHGPRLLVAYRGSTYSDQLPFQHGLALGGHWILASGPIAGLEFVTFNPATSESDFVTLQIARMGGGAHVGWRFAGDPFALEAELGYQGEVVQRSILATKDDFPADGPLRRWQSAAGLVIRFELSLTRSLGVFLGVGGHAVLNNFESIAIVDDEPSPVSTPFPVRVSARAGLLLWP